MLVKLIKRKIITFVGVLHEIFTFFFGRNANIQKVDSEKEFKNQGEDSD
jgi:hypothetical protein